VHPSQTAPLTQQYRLLVYFTENTVVWCDELNKRPSYRVLEEGGKWKACNVGLTEKDTNKAIEFHFNISMYAILFYFFCNYRMIEHIAVYVTA
jgi:hypothetical protein